MTISAVVPEVFHDPQVAGLMHLVAGHVQRGGVVLAPRVVVQPAEHAQPERAAHLSSVSKFVFYAQSTRTLISERKIFCRHTINVKNMYILKLLYRGIFKNRLQKWIKHKQNQNVDFVSSQNVKTFSSAMS